MSNSSPILNRFQRRGIGVVLLGNFMEYFDLMLVSHLAFVITPYFTPQTDPVLASRIKTILFISSFVIRPFAAVFWGMIGDKHGRVKVLATTTLIMSLSCLLLPCIPSHTEWGWYSVAALLGCRILQGISSSGESKAIEVYLVESVPVKPKVYFISTLATITSLFGGLLATGLGSLAMEISQDGWKYCFYIGATIAFCSFYERLKLKETNDFLNKTKVSAREEAILERYKKRNFLALIGLNVIGPTAMFFGYSVCTDFLKDVGLSDTGVLLNNSSILFIEILCLFVVIRLSYRFDPFSILKVRTYLTFLMFPLCFLMLKANMSHTTIYITQVVTLVLTEGFDPATPIIIQSFAIKNRFTNYTIAWAITKACMYLFSSFLLNEIHQKGGMWGLLAVMLFFSTVFLISLYQFVPREKMREDLSVPVAA